MPYHTSTTERLKDTLHTFASYRDESGAESETIRGNDWETLSSAKYREQIYQEYLNFFENSPPKNPQGSSHSR